MKVGDKTCGNLPAGDHFTGELQYILTWPSQSFSISNMRFPVTKLDYLKSIIRITSLYTELNQRPNSIT